MANRGYCMIVDGVDSRKPISLHDNARNPKLS